MSKHPPLPPTMPQVGAMDPDLQNSPVAEEFEEESDTIRQQVPGEPICYFNGSAFAHDQYVRCGSQVLKCSYGVWLEVPSEEPGVP